MKNKVVSKLFISSVLSGMAIWFVFSLFLNTEPWDSKYGVVVMGILGFIFGLIGFERPWLWPIGIYLGQFLYGSLSLLKSLFFYSGGGANFFFPLGIIFLIPFCFPALIMSFVGAAIQKVFIKLRRRESGQA